LNVLKELQEDSELISQIPDISCCFLVSIFHNLKQEFLNSGFRKKVWGMVKAMPDSAGGYLIMDQEWINQLKNSLLLDQEVKRLLLEEVKEWDESVFPEQQALLYLPVAKKFLEIYSP
jgi:hypothetical protein